MCTVVAVSEGHHIILQWKRAVCVQVIRKYPVIYTESMNTVLRQELIRYNRLIKVVHTTLRYLMRAIQVSRSTHLPNTHIDCLL